MTDSLAELQALWRHRLAEAKLRLTFARNYTIEVQRDFASGKISVPAERYAQQQALRGETYALAEYRRVLRIVTALVLHGDIPGEKDGRADGANRPIAPASTLRDVVRRDGDQSEL